MKKNKPKINLKTDMNRFSYEIRGHYIDKDNTTTYKIIDSTTFNIDFGTTDHQLTSIQETAMEILQKIQSSLVDDECRFFRLEVKIDLMCYENDNNTYEGYHTYRIINKVYILEETELENGAASTRWVSPEDSLSRGLDSTLSSLNLNKLKK